MLTCYGQTFPDQHYQCKAYMIPNQPKAYYYVYSYNGICWGHIRTSMVIRHSHNHPSSPATPANSTTDTIQHTQCYNIHNDTTHTDTNYRFTYLRNLPPLCHVTTAWIIHTASYKIYLCD